MVFLIEFLLDGFFYRSQRNAKAAQTITQSRQIGRARQLFGGDAAISCHLTSSTFLLRIEIIGFGSWQTNYPSRVGAMPNQAGIALIDEVLNAKEQSPPGFFALLAKVRM
jgi:hypothetical protein